MNGSIVLLGVAIVLGVVLAGPLWARAGTPRSARLLLGAAGAGWITAGLVPGDVDEEVHPLGALGVFVAGNLGLILAGLRSRGSGRTALRVGAVFLGVLGTVATVLFFSGEYLGLGLGGMERVAAYALPVATFAWAVVLLRPEPIAGVDAAATGAATADYPVQSRATRS